MCVGCFVAIHRQEKLRKVNEGCLHVARPI